MIWSHDSDFHLKKYERLVLHALVTLTLHFIVKYLASCWLPLNSTYGFNGIKTDMNAPPSLHCCKEYKTLYLYQQSNYTI